MFERFTERARQVVVLAQEQSRTRRHNYIGTEHLLLGLLTEEEDIAAAVLLDVGVNIELVREAVERHVPPGEEVRSGSIPFTERAKQVFVDALKESMRLSHNYIGTEHLLLGLASQPEGLATRVLEELSVDRETVRARTLEAISTAPRSPERPRMPDPHAGSVVVAHDPDTRTIIRLAAARALSQDRERIVPRDLLYALTKDDSLRSILAELGVDAEVLRDRLDRD